MRLLEILFYLLKINSKITIKELAKKFNVSEKTIQRDLDKLSLLGIPIISYRGVNGGIELDKNYIIAKYILTENDYRDLILSLYISENIVTDLKESNLIDKFRFVDSERCLKILSKLEDRLVIDWENKKSINERNVCEIIDKSLDEKAFIKIEVEGKVEEVIPISYVLKQEGLYLYYYHNEYKLILIKSISNAWKCEKYFEEETIKYNDNKENVKYYSSYTSCNK